MYLFMVIWYAHANNIINVTRKLKCNKCGYIKYTLTLKSHAAHKIISWNRDDQSARGPQRQNFPNLCIYIRFLYKAYSCDRNSIWAACAEIKFLYFPAST